MKTRLNAKNNDELSILGFGCMRFPTKGGAIDEPRSVAMIRKAIEQGINYFDTAYIYHGGKSESLLGTALEGGYREKVKIATKLPPYMVSKLEGARKILENQLRKLKTDYIDYYLLHMLTDKAMFDRMVNLGVMTWLEELKSKGVIKNIGFSFHGGKQDFLLILNAYPWDFCQIQYNYLDENNQATREGLEAAASKRLPVIVMEPLRGGKLVTHLPGEVVKAFKDQNSRWSPAEWALRWIWNHRSVTVVLSGMSDEAQLEENLRIAGDMKPGSLTGKELEVFERVKAVMLEKTKVPCTACGYCMPCPAGVDIPGCFSSYNDKFLMSDGTARLRYFQSLGALSAKPAVASRCIECGKCESHCPQNIPIRRELKNVARSMEGFLYKPLVGVVRRIMRVK